MSRCYHLAICIQLLLCREPSNQSIDLLWIELLVIESQVIANHPVHLSHYHIRVCMIFLVSCISNSFNLLHFFHLHFIRNLHKRNNSVLLLLQLLLLLLLVAHIQTLQTSKLSSIFIFENSLIFNNKQPNKKLWRVIKLYVEFTQKKKKKRKILVELRFWSQQIVEC